MMSELCLQEEIIREQYGKLNAKLNLTFFYLAIVHTLGVAPSLMRKSMRVISLLGGATNTK